MKAELVPIAAIYLGLMAACAGMPSQSPPEGISHEETSTQVGGEDEVLGPSVSPEIPAAKPGDVTQSQPSQSSWIYIWIDRFDSAEYGRYNPELPNQPFFEIVTPGKNEVIGPQKAISLAFDPLSEQLVYITNESQLLLWHGETSLININVVDLPNSDSWEPIAADHAIGLAWGPGSSFIRIWNVLDPSQQMLFSLNRQEFILLGGDCAFIRTGGIQGPELLCPLPEPEGGYLSLKTDGTMSVHRTQPSNAVAVIEAAFSPDGLRAIYAAPDEQLYLVTPGMLPRPLKAAISSTRDLYEESRSHLEWSRNGLSVLAYGKPYDRSCPESGLDGNAKPCWFVMNQEGEILWTPDERLAESLKSDWEKLIDGRDAALAPDGNQVVTFFLDPPLRWGVLVSLETNDIRPLSFSDITYVTWD